MFYLKIYNKFHNILDEIHEFSNLSYTKTLNGVGKCGFSVPLNHAKTTINNYTLANHVEVYYGSKLVWGGCMVQLDFGATDLTVGCYGYLEILNHRRLRGKTYPNMKYSELFKTVFRELDAIYPLQLIEGSFDDNCISTQRKVENKDMALDKFLKWCEDSNYYIEVSADRKFNFATVKERKTYYELIHGTSELDNIVNAPSLSQSILEMSNNVYSESTSSEGEAKTIITVNADNSIDKYELSETTISTIKKDDASITKYGLYEGVFNANNDIVKIETLNTYTNEELRKTSYPSNNISLEVANSSLCPIHELQVGDIVTVWLKNYFNFKDELRILEITINAEKNTASLVVGETLFKPTKPIKMRYAK